MSLTIATGRARFRLHLWLLVGSVLLLVPAGCGGSMDLTDYFDEMQATSDVAEARYVALSGEAHARLAELEFSPPGGWDADVAQAGEQLLVELTDERRFTSEALALDVMIYEGLEEMLDAILARIQEIDPPDQAMDQHAEMVSAAAEWAGLVTDLTTTLNVVGSADELAGQLAPLDLNSRSDVIDGRFESACLALQAVADLDAEATFEFNGPWLGGLSLDDATADFACG